MVEKDTIRPCPTTIGTRRELGVAAFSDIATSFTRGQELDERLKVGWQESIAFTWVVETDGHCPTPYRSASFIRRWARLG